MIATDGVTRDWRQARRFQALELIHRGWFQRDVAEAFGVSEVTVSRWLAQARVGGAEALMLRTSPGRPPALSAAQRRLIPEFLSHGPEAYGFRGAVWTTLRVARVIEEEFGVSYHKGHVARLLKRLHWTPQMPIHRAMQRDEPLIDQWRRTVWPRLLRQAKTQRRTVVFVDEAGFYLLPSVVKTYAPITRTPILRHRLTRDHLSVMAGMTPEGRVYTLVRQHALDGVHSVEFLLHLLAVAARRLMVIWDGSPIHRRAIVNALVARTRGKLRIELLPAYAPDLNPWDEGGWNHLKNVELRNLACRDLEELHEQFHMAVGRLRHKPRLVRAFFAQAGLIV